MHSLSRNDPQNKYCPATGRWPLSKVATLRPLTVFLCVHAEWGWPPPERRSVEPMLSSFLMIRYFKLPCSLSRRSLSHQCQNIWNLPSPKRLIIFESSAGKGLLACSCRWHKWQIYGIIDYLIFTQYIWPRRFIAHWLQNKCTIYSYFYLLSTPKTTNDIAFQIRQWFWHTLCANIGHDITTSIAANGSLQCRHGNELQQWTDDQ